MGNPVARAFAITGDAWTQLIMREAFYGVRRFSVWRERLGTPRSVLTDRLQKLVAAGLLAQTPVATSARTEYRNYTAMYRAACSGLSGRASTRMTCRSPR